MHPDYSKLAARLAVSHLHKTTHDDYLKVINELKNQLDRVGRPAPLLADDIYCILRDNVEKI